uniref:C2H2-type domain-containing protein n=1 Tax=Spongospora subterranea TaxID=70186 RepID=A0A0H5RGP9_9EUKA|eukprot:CRZ07854.1 hypothetical protein [Spongospora subterranea]
MERTDRKRPWVNDGWCGLTRPEHLRRHALVHSGERPYPCHQCTQAFRSSHHLKRHVRTHSSEFPFTCEHCLVGFAKAFQLREHSFAHTQIKAFACEFDGCAESFVLKAELAKHVKSHRQTKIYRCEICETETLFSNFSDKIRHLKQEHANRFCCPTCQKTFKTRSRLKSHSKVHDVNSRIWCPQCPKTYTTQVKFPSKKIAPVYLKQLLKANLEIHIRTIHDKIRPFLCNEGGCGKSFALNKCLVRHTDRCHVNPKPRVKKLPMAVKNRFCGREDISAIMTDSELRNVNPDTAIRT